MLIPQGEVKNMLERQQLDGLCDTMHYGGAVIGLERAASQECPDRELVCDGPSAGEHHSGPDPLHRQRQL